MIKASSEDDEYMNRPKDWRQQQRRQGLDYGPEESTTTIEASAEEDEQEDYNNDNKGVGVG